MDTYGDADSNANAISCRNADFISIRHAPEVAVQGLGKWNTRCAIVCVADGISRVEFSDCSCWRVYSLGHRDGIRELGQSAVHESVILRLTMPRYSLASEEFRTWTHLHCMIKCERQESKLSDDSPRPPAICISQVEAVLWWMHRRFWQALGRSVHAKAECWRADMDL